MGPDEPVGEKAWWRAGILAARQERPAADLERARAAVRHHVLARCGGFDCVAAYLPLRTEPGSSQLLAELHAGGTEVLVPVTLPDRDLDWVTWTPSGCGPPLGREAIGRAGLLIVPALAVARDGTRLGRGGGSYDRALARRAPGAITAALLFDDELLSELPRDPWDVPVDAAVTPNGWVDLRRNTDLGFAR